MGGVVPLLPDLSLRRVGVGSDQPAVFPILGCSLWSCNDSTGCYYCLVQCGDQGGWTTTPLYALRGFFRPGIGTELLFATNAPKHGYFQWGLAFFPSRSLSRVSRKWAQLAHCSSFIVAQPSAERTLLFFRVWSSAEARFVFPMV